ncbi:interferon gamma receptor 2 isoform X2 [Onychomys torridus]|uniref:interferon gamma receptor 2 isoform X2 n=1 Tax=Onychomys torridus TaxID=38674 RepID=UPI00167FAE1D|nr:interferon gamma receptor 2 isoform X2 [Onychomys torridus]
MRPPPLWLLSLLLGGLGAAAPPPAPLIPYSSQDPDSRLAAPQHLELLLYNDEQILSWAPSPPSNDTRPVVYQVEYRYTGSWTAFKGVNCTDITVTRCDFTGGGRLKGFPGLYSVLLRVRARQGERTSDWVTSTRFQRYCNVTVGPPKNISVTPGKGSLTLHFSPPFDVAREAGFEYRVRYWEKAGAQQVRGPFKKNSIVLDNLKPFRVYCLQTEAQLIVREKNICRPGLSLSNVSCHETAADASTSLQVILIPVGTFSLLLVLTGACFFLFLKYQSRVKYWFQAPPNIPEQIREYLKDPDQPILEALDKDSSPKDDAWDSVLIISSPEEEQDDLLQTL